MDLWYKQILVTGNIPAYLPGVTTVAAASVIHLTGSYPGFFSLAGLPIVISQLHMEHAFMLQIIPTTKSFIMEMGKILSADVLDIIFDQRNKEYGAYDLRKNYQRRLTKSLSITFLVAVLLCVTYILLASIKPDAGKMIVTSVLELEKVTEKDKPVEKLPPPPQKITPPQDIRMIRSTPPIIVKEDVPDDEKPPLNDDLDDAKIGTVNTDGKDDIGVVTPPVDDAKGVVAMPEKHSNGDETFRKVEIDAQYPGGLEAWRVFITRKLVYPQEAVDEGKQGTVYVQFIVDKEGNVSDVNAISGPPELYAAAVSVIKKSGKWEPGIQNGQKVKSYKSQPITFRLDGDQ